MLHVPPQGDPRARIYIVGEAPGEDEEIAGIPFVGKSGQELDRILRDCGIERSECYVTNLCQYRPPNNDMEKWLKKKELKKGTTYDVHPLVQEGQKDLLEKIERYRPSMVIGFGNTALWGLTNEWGIGAWRGSEMVLQGGIHFVPTLHPAAVLRQWELRALVLHDLRYRVVRRLKCGFHVPTYRFNVNPSYDEVIEFIESSDTFAADIETAQGKTICLGLARSPYESICIPFWNEAGRRWEVLQERIFVAALEGKKLIGQNWNYDRQYLKNDFDVELPPDFDTYIAQSVLFPGSERGLGYLSSMYCEYHMYWKEEAKDWGTIRDFGKLFRYNCKDTCTTFEAAQGLGQLIEAAGLKEQFASRMHYANYVYRMMMRGVQRCPKRTRRMIREVDVAVGRRVQLIEKLAGKKVDFASSVQVANFLFKDKGFKPTAKTDKGKPSTKDEALQKLVEKTPEAAEFCTPILEARSLSTIKSNFLQAQLDPDGRLRSSWMATGTETFRLTSSKNAYRRGGPLQNITDGKHTHSGRPLPNLRSTIVPPQGHVYWNCDLERADLQVVAWEADDASLKKMLKDRVDMHLVNACDLFDLKNLPYEECFESHPKYQEHKERHEQPRHFAKTFVHLTNYGGKARTCAAKTHTTVHKADLLQRRWFSLHNGIERWHQWTMACLLGNRTVRNKFGYRRVYLGRIEDSFTEALAWVPQSTVGIVISHVQMNMEDDVGGRYPVDFGIELQGHDSLAGWMNRDKQEVILPLMRAAAEKVIVPYDDPLYIPLELALSEDSWGNVKKMKWPEC